MEKYPIATSIDRHETASGLNPNYCARELFGVTQLAPDDIAAHSALTATYSMMGLEKEARAEAAEVLRINPRFSVDSVAKTSSYKDQSQRDKIANALRKAGLK